MLPRYTFIERLVRVYFRCTEDNDRTTDCLDCLEKAFKKWKETQPQSEVSRTVRIAVCKKLCISEM